MLSSLGIYVDKNLIKYAKLKKVKDSYKVESFNVEVFEDLKIEQYISYKEGKTIEDLTSALVNVNFKEVIAYLTSGERINSTDLLVVLGINDIINLKVEDLFKALFKLVNVETLNLVEKMFKLK